MKTILRKIVFALASVSLLAAGSAQAEGRIRIVQQFGIPYLFLNVAEEQKLIEKYGKEAGIDIQVEFLQLSGGAATNDALLAGNVDVAGAGIAPVLTLWDRTRGRQNVRVVSSLGNLPYYLVTINPKVKTIADFTEQDRIASPAAGVSIMARYLQLASSRLWGPENWNKLDPIQVSLPHPTAAAAIIKGGTEVTAHFGNPPFQEQELASNPNARIVLSSYDVMGGPTSPTVLYATEKFRKDNPKTYDAFIKALEEAAKFVNANPEGAADIFLAKNKGIDRALLLKILKSPEYQFKLAPQNTYPLAEFMHRIGAIKNKPVSAQDYFFDDAHLKSGS